MSTTQIVGEQASHFPKRFGWANYDDGNFNVGLAVFSIHGNHDDPGRDGGGSANSVSLLCETWSQILVSVIC